MEHWSFRRPLIMIRGRKIKFTIGFIVVVLFIAITVGYFTKKEDYSNVPGSDSLPVSGVLNTTEIQFQAESIAPTSQGQAYFVNYRLERDQFQQEAKVMLGALLNSTDAKNKSAAQAKWLELSNKISLERELENLLKIKGFQDVVTDINSDSVSVVVFAQSLTPNEVFLLQDTIIRLTKVRLDRIIISVKK